MFSLLYPPAFSHEQNLESRKFIFERKKKKQNPACTPLSPLEFLIAVVVVVVQVCSLMRPVNVSIRTF